MDIFTTSRLIAERLHPRHLPELTALHLDPEVSRYLGGTRSREATKAYVEVNIGHWERHGFGLWVLRTRDGAFVGRAGIRPLTVEGAPEIEVAYALARSFWGKGLASEITRALVDQGLERHDLSSLIGVASLDNIASCRVLEKSGFTFERNVVHAGEPCALYRQARHEPDAPRPA